MSTDVTAASSATPPTEAADLFYKTDAQPQAESAPATEKQHSAPASKEASETASASEAETAEDSEQNSEQKPQRTNAEKRIQQLLAENKRLKSERENPPQRTEATKADTPKPEASKAETAPDPNDPKFETYADYLKADRAFQQKHVDQRIKDAIESDRAEQSRLHTEQQQREAFVTKQQELLDSVKATEKRHPDFKEKVFDETGSLRSDIQLNPVVDQFIPHSKVGMEMLYHFATNPAEQARFAALNGYDALREAIQLEAKLTQGLDQTPPQNQKPKLKPPSTVSGKGAAPKAMSAEEVLYGAD